MIDIRPVITNKDCRAFVDFQFKLYQNHPFWVPPLKSDEVKQLTTKTNPAFFFCDAQFWTAWKEGRCVGRIGAIVNHDYNKKIGKEMGRFTRFEVIDDVEVTKALFEVAEKWLSEKGAVAIHGPLGFTNLDNQGLLIEGFEYLPSIASVMHFPYYQKHIEELGYSKENDWVEFLIKIEEIPEKATRLVEIIKQRNNLEVIHLKEKKEMILYLNEVFYLLNRAFDELPYVSPFSDELIKSATQKYMDVLVPKYIVMIKKEGQLAAFIIGLPSLSKAMQKANGHLFPFGFLHIKKALKKPEVLDLLLTGVDPHYQKLGLPAILISELQNTMLENGIKYVETTGMFETNLKGATTWKNYDHIQHKRRRCFVKQL
ncbi:MAG: hypothetical protein COW63_17765 [Bacteroidetes bacterium CG18_big_fil_WC_8_21_14_2_50_41_14]|nr:MAG: hypothetical protein COW63_17765 [Bacteroidetes bacterium CG18_big_fil_WC_8_21_14_2_50_41_14]PJB58833.1 MAG: hypothetical protein CO098_06520 [Bacteroidetes bacterium CG_4_9_14_3_um_filter_41_19]